MKTDIQYFVLFGVSLFSLKHSMFARRDEDDSNLSNTKEINSKYWQNMKIQFFKVSEEYFGGFVGFMPYSFQNPMIFSTQWADEVFGG